MRSVSPAWGWYSVTRTLGDSTALSPDTTASMACVQNEACMGHIVLPLSIFQPIKLLLLLGSHQYDWHHDQSNE